MYLPFPNPTLVPEIIQRHLSHTRSFGISVVTTMYIYHLLIFSFVTMYMVKVDEKNVIFTLQGLLLFLNKSLRVHNWKVFLKVNTVEIVYLIISNEAKVILFGW